VASTVPTTDDDLAPERPAGRSGRRPSSAERRAVHVVAVLAGVGACFAPGRPTALWVVDLVLLAGFAVLVTEATARARRWTWIVLAGLAAVAADGGVWVAAAALALTIAVIGGLLSRRRIIGAVVAALAVQVLLRLPDMGFEGASALYVAVAVAPALVSAYLLSPRRRRRIVARVALGLVAAAAVGVAVLGVAVAAAQQDVRRGVDLTQQGLEAIGDGDQARAAVLLDDASASLESGRSSLDAWWAVPARAVPVVAQQAEALTAGATEAAAIAGAVGEASSAADLDQIRYLDGRIDVARLRAAADPLAAAEAAMVDAQARLDGLDRGWLLPPVAERLDTFDERLTETLPEATLAAEGARELPAVLGADGTRRYLVLFTQPAESRGLGGFVGSYAELTAVDGEVELTRSGPINELLTAPGRGQRTLTGPADYLARYGRFRPQEFLQDLTLSPDLPSVAQAAAELYPQAGGQPVDGVIVADPAGLAALLRITGPIRVPDLDRPVTADDAVDLLTREQYLLGAGEQARRDLLEDVGRETFDALVSGDVPAPRELGDILAPAVAGRHLMVYLFDESEEALVRRVGADGAVAPVPGGDGFLLSTQNKGNNKIDVYLQRQVGYRGSYDPTSGELTATATVTLTNTAPAEGLPDAVIGSNDQGLPPGTNAMFFSFYTPHRLAGARIDGQQAGMEFQRELGWAVYSRFLEIPAGGTVTVELDLTGTLSSGAEYPLAIGYQPLVNPDQVSVEMAFVPPWLVAGVDGFGVTGRGQGVSAEVQPEEPTVLTAELVAP
jgi:hypothetical protein